MSEREPTTIGENHGYIAIGSLCDMGCCEDQTILTDDDAASLGSASADCHRCRHDLTRCLLELFIEASQLGKIQICRLHSR